MFESPTKSIWWLPTLGFFLFLAIEAVMFADPGRIFADPGVGRHLRTAEYILETGQIPRTDPLSFTKAGAPWTDFEWAFEATLGELYRAGGLNLVCAFCFAIFAATVLGIYRTVLQAGVGLAPVFFVTMLAGCTLVIHFSARPVLFTYLFFALVVEVWNRRSAPLLRDWILLPLIFAAWANLHGGWMGALVFLGLAMAGRLVDRIARLADGDQAPLIPWIGLTGLCAIAVSFNPWGWSLYRSTFLLATSLKSAALWEEYLPPDFRHPKMSAIAIIFIGVVLVLTRLRRLLERGRSAPSPWKWENVVPVIFFLYEGMKAQRHVLLLVEVATVPLAWDLQVLLPALLAPVQEIFDRFQTRQREAGGDAWLALVAAVVLVVLFVHTPLPKPIQVGRTVSPQLVEFLREHTEQFQRPFTTTGNAGPLLWAMRPDFRVSIDDRGDFYGDDYVFRFADTIRGAPGWEKTLETGKFDSLLLDPNWKLNDLLKSKPEWKEAWRDKNIVVYWRDAVEQENMKQ
jgi:hypothetical protein